MYSVINTTIDHRKINMFDTNLSNTHLYVQTAFEKEISVMRGELLSVTQIQRLATLNLFLAKLYFLLKVCEF